MPSENKSTKKNQIILSNINSPKDLKRLNDQELKILAQEIREKIILTTSKTGGHVASSLGVVELTIALHYTFDLPKDKIVWDVSHQCYTHKILTGRKDFFSTLRQDDGCSGFTSRSESEYDVFGAGHAGTAVSAALGLAAARDKQHGKEKVIAFVGDGSLTCGVTLEGLNNVSEITKDFIIILNDNKMSISKNVGGITTYLNRIISNRKYNKFRSYIRSLILKIPKFGNIIRKTIGKIEEAAKSIFVPGVFFEDLGIRYVGPINGHDIKKLVETFTLIKDFDTPVVVHVLTEKGRGFKPAENQPEKFHGLDCYDPETGNSLNKKTVTYSSAFGKSIVKLAKKHHDVVAITAAMCSGTGLQEFSERFPDRFFDVGIAEEHAVIFAAGLACSGFRPIIAMYATFLQRALGCVFHDVCLQNLPVTICTDRSGIVDDGPTHHGIHDVSYLRALPNISILYPMNDVELDNMLHAAYEQNSPAVIRYPRGEIFKHNPVAPLQWGKAETILSGNTISIWATGKECFTALEVSNILQSQFKITPEVVNTRFLKPFDKEKLIDSAQKFPIITIEDNQIQGGLGSIIDEILINEKHHGVLHFGWNDSIIPHGTNLGIRAKFDLTPEKIANKIIKHLN